MQIKDDKGRGLTRAGVAAAVAGMLMTGAAWRGVAAARTAAEPIPAVTSPIAHAVAGGRDSYADVVDVVAPAVVTVRVEGKARVAPTQFGGPMAPDDDFMRRFFGDQSGRRAMPPAQRQRGLGSGVIVTSDGYILTNYHVVNAADDIRVEVKDGRTLVAKLVGSDGPSDLALLKVEATGLRPLALGDSDAVRVGDVVLAVGNPLGVGQTVTMGIISAKGRATGTGDGGYEDFLQTDAPINHGNSGGALVNTRGELVGINSQILSNSDGNIGIGFAIPSNMAHQVMDQLKTRGKVTRAQLGVTVQGVTSDLAESLNLKAVGGAIVSGVAPGSAADRAGLTRGDVIQSFNGAPVSDANGLRNRVASTAPGSTSDVVINRDGVEKHVSVTLDEATGGRPDARGSKADSDDKASLGISVSPITPELAARAGAPRDVTGVLVQDVDPNGRAAGAGVQPGDIVQEVNRQPVHNVDDLRGALRRASDKPTLLLVKRHGQDLFVTVRPRA